MPQVAIQEDTYQLMSIRAQSAKVSVDEWLAPILRELVKPELPKQPSHDVIAERLQRFQEWQEIVEARAGDYPAGFQVDDSRETIYEGR